MPTVHFQEKKLTKVFLFKISLANLNESQKNRLKELIKEQIQFEIFFHFWFKAIDSLTSE
jgi:hypothetical protein